MDSLGGLRVSGSLGFVILRQGKVHYGSPAIYFRIPDKERFELIYNEPVSPARAPARAYTSTHQLQEGDVVLFATEGFWGNITGHEILGDVSVMMLETHCWKIQEERGVIAASSEHLAAATRDPSGALHTALARAVIRKSESMDANPPVLKEGREVTDDIAAVVTVVTKDSRNPFST